MKKAGMTGQKLLLKLSAADTEAALESIRSRGIVLMHLVQEDALTCRFWILGKDYIALETLCSRRGDVLEIIKHRGIVRKAALFLQRPVLLAGFAVLLCLVQFLPTRVLFVRVEGNEQISSREILSAAERCGICFGASRREVRSEKMKNALLAAIPQLQWAGINTAGCTAVISVREGERKESAPEKQKIISIVADRDGYILSGTVTRGTGLVQVGQAVKAGQTLISAYTDCGIYLQATRAEGEVYAQTKRDLAVLMPAEACYRGEEQQVRRNISLIIRKKRINLWKDSGISGSSCGRMYKEYYVTLPGGYQLPAAVCIETITSCETRPRSIPETEAQLRLPEFARDYLSRQMLAGTILQGTGTVALSANAYRFEGQYVCTEMIGREMTEQIGDTNGKND